MGPPVQRARPHAGAVQRESDFPGTVFGISRDEVTIEKVAGHYVEFFGRHRPRFMFD